MPYDYANANFSTAQDIARLVVDPLQGLWGSAVAFLPTLVAALFVLLVGLVVATGLAALVEKIFDALRLDKFLRGLGVEPYFQRAGIRLHSSHFLGQLVFWFLAIAFLEASSGIIGLAALSDFFKDVRVYLPNVVVATLIMLATVVVANFLKRLVSASVKSANLPSAHFLGSLVWWAVAVFGIMATLIQLDVAREVVSTIITGFIAMLALAGGLAFGLGGRDYATHLVNKLRDHTESR